MKKLYSYLIRLPCGYYGHTTPTPYLQTVVNQVRRTLLKLKKKGHISDEEIGTFVAGCQAFVDDIIDREKELRVVPYYRQHSYMQEQKRKSAMLKHSSDPS